MGNHVWPTATWPLLTDGERCEYHAIVLAALLVCGVTAGLIHALFSIKGAQYRRLQLQRSRCSRLAVGLIDNGYWTLVSLLVIRALVETVVPLLLSRVYGHWVALLLAVSLILICADVVPQAIFVRHNIAIATFFAPVVWAVVGLTSILSWPFAMMLQRFVGKETRLFTRAEFAGLVHCDNGLGPADAAMLRGALEMTERTVGEADVIPVARCFMLPHSALLTPSLLAAVGDAGVERVPVFKASASHRGGPDAVSTRHDAHWGRPFDRKSAEEANARTTETTCAASPEREPWDPLWPHGDREHIVGVLLAKDLLPFLVDPPPPGTQVMDLQLRDPLRVADTATLHDVYDQLRHASVKIAAVYRSAPGREQMLRGFVTEHHVHRVQHRWGVEGEELDGPMPSTATFSTAAARSVRHSQVLSVYGALGHHGRRDIASHNGSVVSAGTAGTGRLTGGGGGTYDALPQGYMTPAFRSDDRRPRRDHLTRQHTGTTSGDCSPAHGPSASNFASEASRRGVPPLAPLAPAEEAPRAASFEMTDERAQLLIDDSPAK